MISQIWSSWGLWELLDQWNTYSIFEQILKMALGTVCRQKHNRLSLAWHWRVSWLTHESPVLSSRPAEDILSLFVEWRTALGHSAWIEHTSCAWVCEHRAFVCGWWMAPCLCRAFLYLEEAAEDISISGIPAVQYRQNAWKLCFMFPSLIFLFLKD